MKFSKKILNIKPSATLSISGRAKTMKAEGKPVLSFSAGEPDYDPPKSACEAAVAAIEKKADLVAQVADEIWSFAELSLQEEQSADLYCRVLEQEGFKVERGICNIPTAFSASYGSGRPIIGLLAEYDALSGLSQKGGSLTREELVSGGCGHGCGHNLLGAGAMAAALGVKAYLEAAKIPGTVVLYGCPGEEGGAAKAFMARDGLWYGLDAALTWHPDDANEVLTGSSNSCIQTQYHFTGVAAHAAAPWTRWS